MFILYDLIFLIIALIYLPLYLFRRKFHRGFLLRLGLLPKNLALDHPIWIHAVSVGEVIVAGGILAELRQSYPHKRFVISTVTPTGNKIAKTIARTSDFVTFLPLDLSFIVSSVINRIKPSLFIVIETEIWPNLISCLYRKHIPSIVVNGRISDSSFKGYCTIKFLISPVLRKINLFCVQSSRDAERLISLGVSKDKIQITGNMKFDIKDYTDLKKTCLPAGRDYTDYKLKLGLESKEKLLVAGSTHPGEEKIILNVYKKLLIDSPDLKLLIAPRHPERASEIEKLIKGMGWEVFRISKLGELANLRTCELPVFILDTIGQLLRYYAIADIVFVGGSLVKKGGHNILEPAILGKPIIFGPYMFNFRDIADLFLNNKGAVLAHNQEELENCIRDLLNNLSKITELSQAAKELVFNNQGATRRNLECIKVAFDDYKTLE